MSPLNRQFKYNPQKNLPSLFGRIETKNINQAHIEKRVFFTNRTLLVDLGQTVAKIDKKPLSLPLCGLLKNDGNSNPVFTTVLCITQSNFFCIPTYNLSISAFAV